ncbi:MAG: hypothetical protein OEZ06_05250 [Myxococcales bacterium]|nr:hypothetical protein [Myxococcales bacterium]
MTPIKPLISGTLSQRDLTKTTEWLCQQQRSSGEIPWSQGAKTDPWDHVHAAMGLTVMGRVEEAKAAYRFMADTQDPNGGWPTERRGGKATRVTQDSNHAAYLATGLWHLYCYRPDPDFLAEMWPTLERALNFVLAMQLPTGAIAWAQKNGKVWEAPLLTGSSSIHGSLVCAIRIAERLGHHRPGLVRAREKLSRVIRNQPAVFSDTDLPEKPGRHSMDWYYPVLGGALRGAEGRRRLLDASLTAAFIQEGAGCRCVKDQPWYTVAETCELVLALHASGLTQRAREILSWTRWQRTDNGAYWTGTTFPACEIFPDGEQTTWTAAAVLLAHDAVHLDSRTSDFFTSLDGADLYDSAKPARPRPERPVSPDYVSLRTPAE